MISKLRKTSNYTLLDKDSQPCTDMKYADYIQFESEAPTSLQDPSGYKNYNNWTILYFHQNKHLQQTDYMSASMKLSTELSKPLLTVSMLDRRDLLEYLLGKADSIPGLSLASQDINEQGAQQEQEQEHGKTVKKPKLIDPSVISEADKQFVNFIHSRERGLRTFTTVLLSKGSKGFENIRQMAVKQLRNEITKKKPVDGKSSKPSVPAQEASYPSKHTLKPTPSTRPVNAKGKPGPDTTPSSSSIPIIILPAGAQSLVTLYNVKDLLIDKKYVPSDDYRSKGIKKPDMVEINRDPKSTPAHVPKRFIILDSVDSLKTPQDWERVVAVFTLGQEWQFKGWLWKSPVEIFNKSCGFSLKFTDDPPKPSIQNWKVEQLNINRSKRYLDSTMVFTFWQKLDNWLNMNKNL